MIALSYIHAAALVGHLKDPGVVEMIETFLSGDSSLLLSDSVMLAPPDELPRLEAWLALAFLRSSCFADTRGVSSVAVLLMIP